MTLEQAARKILQISLAMIFLSDAPKKTNTLKKNSQRIYVFTYIN